MEAEWFPRIGRGRATSLRACRPKRLTARTGWAAPDVEAQGDATDSGDQPGWKDQPGVVHDRTHQGNDGEQEENARKGRKRPTVRGPRQPHGRFSSKPVVRYSDSPAASRAFWRSMKISARTAFPSWRVQTYQTVVSTGTPLWAPRDLWRER